MGRRSEEVKEMKKEKVMKKGKEEVNEVEG